MSKTPLADAIQRYAKKDMHRFHMPGHKGKATGIFPAAFTALDVTEIEETDNLMEPKGCILAAERLCASAFGAQRTFFTTGGSTCGVLAMLHAVLRPGDKVLVDRSCHLSVYAALSLCGAVPVYVRGAWMAQIGAFAPPATEEIASILEKEKDIRALVLTTPTPYGIAADTEAIAAICHARGVLLLVDEAHGAHFAFAPHCPKTALAAGADLCVQSLHKTLPALTGSAVLHVGNPALVHKAEAALRLFQSTSPSYLLMASMDCARAAAEESAGLWEELYAAIEACRFPGLYRTDDPYRLTVSCQGEVSAPLLAAAGFVPEMTGTHTAVMIVTMADSPKTVQRLLDFAKTWKPAAWPAPLPPQCPAVLTPAEVRCREAELVAADEAVGRIVARPVYCYPPGTAIVAPGEVFSREVLLYPAFKEERIWVVQA